MVRGLVRRKLLPALSRTEPPRPRRRDPACFARWFLAASYQGEPHRSALQHSARVQIRRLWVPNRRLPDELKFKGEVDVLEQPYARAQRTTAGETNTSADLITPAVYLCCSEALSATGARPACLSGRIPCPPSVYWNSVGAPRSIPSRLW